ncbi:MAG: Rne/Rng family ribonuclease [Polyangiaceae bacterium]|nr:Rne/Rng family ribonuclease [Polyangiaceae bacterium]
MAKNLLVINVDIRETRVALIENGIIAELQIERHSSGGGTLGNIYLGKVSRVLPGMQAAFIDIGEERAAFLHVEDLIRPDDFDAYLAGHRTGRAKSEEEREAMGDQAVADAGGAIPEAAGSSAQVAEALEPEDDHEAIVEEPDDDALAGFELEGEAEVEAEPDVEAEGDVDADVEAGAETEASLEAPADDEDDDAVVEAEAEAEADIEAEADADDDAAAEAAAEADDDLDRPTPPLDVDLPRVTAEPLSDLPPAEDAPETLAAATPAAEEPGQRAPRARRGGRTRRRGRTKDREAEMAKEAKAAPPPPAPKQDRSRGRDGRRRDDGRGKRDERRGGGGRAKDPLRVSKSTPIREVVREGQEILVQVSKEPIGTKGARVTSHVSLPGRYVVYLPTVEHIGISKRIGSDKERGRLREAIEAMKPPQGGLIVRTLAEGLTKKSLKQDVGYLVRLWGEIVKNREEAKRAPACVYTELDLVLKTARDYFTDDVDKIVIDSKEEYQRLRSFIEMFMPERLSSIELYEGGEPIFDAYGIEDEIGRALSRKVPLPSGGHLIIDQAEALTAIDVNTGRFVGKGSKDLEDTILQTNLEAVEEIAYQLRFRNIGGLIILDLIDMERAANREKVRRRLEQLLAKDKAKTTLNRISELGLIEMTRKRTRESLGRVMNEPCFYCDGTGNLQSKQTVAYEILRQIKRERGSLRGYTVLVNAHPAVVDCMKNEERAAVQEAERRYQRRIELTPRKEYHLEQFDLIGR